MDKKDLIAEFVFSNYLSKGNFSFSMDEIALNLAMSKKTIYRNFTSRDEMLSYCVQSFFRKIEKRFSKLSEQEFHTEQEFRKLIHDWFAVITDLASNFDLSAIEKVQYRHPELWKILNNNRERLLKIYFMKVIRKAADYGLIKKEIPVPLLVLTITSLINNLAVPEIILQHGGIHVFVNFITSIILDGILQKNHGGS